MAASSPSPPSSQSADLLSSTSPAHTHSLFSSALSHALTHPQTPHTRRITRNLSARRSLCYRNSVDRFPLQLRGHDASKPTVTLEEHMLIGKESHDVGRMLYPPRRPCHFGSGVGSSWERKMPLSRVVGETVVNAYILVPYHVECPDQFSPNTRTWTWAASTGTRQTSSRAHALTRRLYWSTWYTSSAFFHRSIKRACAAI